jgi:hypothetical protein
VRRRMERNEGEEGEREAVRTSFLSVILATSPSFIPFNPPPHYLFSFL